MTSQKQQSLVPELRFPEFLSSGIWSDVPIKSILCVRDERQVPTEDVPLFSLTIEGGVTEKTGRYNREFLVRDSGNKKYKVVWPKDIVYNPANLRWGAINYSKLSHAVVVSPIYEVLRLEDESKNHLIFIVSSLMRNAQIRRLITKAQGTLLERVAVKIDDFLSTGLPVPPHKEEQQKIANCLDSLDKLIYMHRSRLNALQDHKKGLLRQLYPAQGQTIPKFRFPEFQNDGEWKEKKLRDCVNIASGLVQPTIPPFCNLPHIGGENIESHTGNILNAKTAKELGLISGKYLFNEHDVLYSKIRPALNKVAIPNFEGICSADIYPLRPFDDQLDKIYLAYLLLSEGFLKYAIKHSARGKIPKINRESLLEYKVALPQRPEQQHIASCLSSLDRLISTQADQITALKEHKKGLMQQLFPNPELNNT